MNTKQTVIRLLSPVFCLVFVFSMLSCSRRAETDDLWKNASYTSDTELGSGAKSLPVEIKVKDHTVKCTVHTDSDTVGAALLENGLISGEQGDYGLYIKSVNGITADYDIDQSYWAFYINGEYAMTGVDSTAITKGDSYQLVYSK